MCRLIVGREYIDERDVGRSDVASVLRRPDVVNAVADLVLTMERASRRHMSKEKAGVDTSTPKRKTAATRPATPEGAKSTPEGVQSTPEGVKSTPVDYRTWVFAQLGAVVKGGK